MTTTDPAPCNLSDRELDIALANLIEQMRHDHPIPYHADDACRHTQCFRCASSAPHYCTDSAAAASALAAIEALGWEWSLKSYFAHNHGGAPGERRYLMRAVRAGLPPVYADKDNHCRTVAECAALALAAMR